MSKKSAYYFSIIIGLFVVFYVQKNVMYSEYLLVIGVILLMFGLYKISRGVASKKEDSNFIKTEYDEEE